MIQHCITFAYRSVFISWHIPVPFPWGHIYPTIPSQHLPANISSRHKGIHIKNIQLRQAYSPQRYPNISHTCTKLFKNISKGNCRVFTCKDDVKDARLLLFTDGVWGWKYCCCLFLLIALIMIQFKRLRVTLVTSIASKWTEWKSQKVAAGYKLAHHHYIELLSELIKANSGEEHHITLGSFLLTDDDLLVAHFSLSNILLFQGLKALIQHYSVIWFYWRCKFMRSGLLLQRNVFWVFILLLIIYKPP